MRFNINVFILVTVILFFGTVTSFAKYNIGDIPDNFTVYDSYGEEVSLWDYYGYVIWLNIWSPT